MGCVGVWWGVLGYGGVCWGRWGRVSLECHLRGFFNTVLQLYLELKSTVFGVVTYSIAIEFYSTH